MTSCKLKKSVIKDRNTGENMNFLSAALINSKEGYKNLQYRFNAKLNFLAEDHNMNGVIRIQKDSIIWMSVRLAIGIEAARIVILKDSIKMASRLADMYISEKISYFERMTNIKMDYELIEAVLTNSLISNNEKEYVEEQGDMGKYLIKRINSNMIEKYIISEGLLSIMEMYFSDGDNNIKVNYDKFENSDYGLFPAMMDMLLKNKSDSIRGKLKISNIEFNRKELKFPFKEK